jgi:hypothetical protein
MIRSVKPFMSLSSLVMIHTPYWKDKKFRSQRKNLMKQELSHTTVLITPCLLTIQMIQYQEDA